MDVCLVDNQHIDVGLGPIGGIVVGLHAEQGVWLDEVRTVERLAQDVAAFFVSGMCGDFSVQQKGEFQTRVSLLEDGFSLAERYEVKLHALDDGGKVVLAQALEKGKLQEVIVHGYFHLFLLMFVKLAFNIQR